MRQLYVQYFEDFMCGNFRLFIYKLRISCPATPCIGIVCFLYLIYSPYLHQCEPCPGQMSVGFSVSAPTARSLRSVSLTPQRLLHACTSTSESPLCTGICKFSISTFLSISNQSIRAIVHRSAYGRRRAIVHQKSDCASE